MVDFLLVLMELFLLGVMADALRVIICSKSAISHQRGSVNPKFQVEGVAPSPTNHSFSPKTRINDLSYGIKIWTNFSFVLSQSTRLTDRQTDERTNRHTEIPSLDRVCIPCSSVIKVHPIIAQTNLLPSTLALNGKSQGKICRHSFNLLNQLKYSNV